MESTGNFAGMWYDIEKTKKVSLWNNLPPITILSPSKFVL